MAAKTTDQELIARVEALEGRVTTNEENILDLDTRVAALEAGSVDPSPPDPPDPEPPEPPEPPAPGTILATVAIPGRPAVNFYETSGIDVGNYVDPRGRFTMTCVRVVDPDCPIIVEIRRVFGWSCVIFRYGDLLNPSGSNLPAYTATVDEVTYEIPGHWKFAMWRHQSGPWPCELTTIDALTADALLPEFDPSVNHGTAKSYGLVSYTPMGLAGVSPYMPGTGGRPDIGFVTDWQADYICNQSETSLANVLAQGEAGATCPWNVRDPDTGAPPDVTSDKWKGASFYAGNGNPQLAGGQGGDTCVVQFSGPPGATIKEPASWPGGPITLYDEGSPQQEWWCYGLITIGADGTAKANSYLASNAGREPTGPMTIKSDNQLSDPSITAAYLPGSNIHGSGISLDISHEPALGYLPFLLTGDPYFLEIVQCQAIMVVLATPKGWAGISPSWGPGMGQTRAVAWATRDMLNAYIATPADVPSWLLSKSALKPLFDMCIASLDHIMAQTEPLRSLQRAVAGSRGSQGSTAFPANCYYQSWQEDFVQCVAAWGAMLDQRLFPFALWHAGGLIARVNPDGTSGWCGGMPDAYQTLFQAAPEGPQFATWEEAWTANQAALGLSGCPPLADLFKQPGGYDYPNGMQAALAISVQAGVIEAEAALAVLGDALEAGLVAGKGMKDWKWSVARPASGQSASAARAAPKRGRAR